MARQQAKRFCAVVESGSCSCDYQRWEERQNCGHLHRTYEAAMDCGNNHLNEHYDSTGWHCNAAWFNFTIHDQNGRRADKYGD